ncbi:MAG: TonB-dependent receptor [Ferruginibacter sp.]
MKKQGLHIFLSSLLLLPLAAAAQQKDTLPAVKVVSIQAEDAAKAAMPLQQLQKTELNALNSVSVAEAAKFFQGVLVRDYGGIGGLKTVSVRSLGANHTGVMYDGVMMGDAQAGQIDLGKFSLDNIESIKLYNGQPVNDLLPARAYASAAVLALNTITADDRKKYLSVQLNAGSFGWVNPSVTVKRKEGENFYHGLNAEYQRADGYYPYKNYVAGTGDSKRQNTGIQTWRAEYDAQYKFSDSNRLHVKLNYYNSRRGLPGAVLLYNTFSDERLNNEVFFTQAGWEKSLNGRSRLLLNAKYTNDYKEYIDPTYQNSAGRLENEFHQQELYLSAAYRYRFDNSWSASYSSDYFRSSLKRTDDFAQGFANPDRDNFLNNIQVGYKKDLFSASANLLHTYLEERTENGAAGRKVDKLTPAVSLAYRLNRQSPFMLRAFYKRILRAPGFDDLYYTNVGNVNLRPEQADQYNAGASFSKTGNAVLKNILVTTDIYYNRVKDRIIAVPRQNLFQWTMLNIGRADIKGLDATIAAKWAEWKKINFTSRLSYTFQDAKDMADPSSASYKKQLPYTPRHSGAIALSALYKAFSCSYNVLLSSYRYRLGEQTPDNLVKEWATQDVVLGYQYTTVKSNAWRFTASFNNIFNKQYEIIKYYPMPRFNYRIGVVATFN